MKKMHPIVWAILCLPVVYFAMVTASVYIPGENVLHFWSVSALW